MTLTESRNQLDSSEHERLRKLLSGSEWQFIITTSFACSPLLLPPVEPPSSSSSSSLMRVSDVTSVHRAKKHQSTLGPAPEGRCAALTGH
ncbi:hypothetical protein Q5P01_005845 [Channa striata]|uniref:Uncharacterized protein n=1 Tax=Channa striata TaxID=64152 RepID=A0AA88T1M2_CHASR|nr:hypothetical protein Q5P01_005845 [Channa striata]